MVFSLVNCLFMLLAPVVLETQCFSLQSVDTLYNKPLILMSAELGHILSTFLTPRTLTAPPPCWSQWHTKGWRGEQSAQVSAIRGCSDYSKFKNNNKPN